MVPIELVDAVEKMPEEVQKTLGIASKCAGDRRWVYVGVIGIVELRQKNKLHAICRECSRQTSKKLAKKLDLWRRTSAEVIQAVNSNVVTLDGNHSFTVGQCPNCGAFFWGEVDGACGAEDFGGADITFDVD